MNKRGVGARPFTTAWIWIALFVVAFVSFAFAFMNLNASQNQMAQDTNLNQTYQGLNNSLAGLQSTSQSWYDAMAKDTPSYVFPFLILVTIVKVPFQIFGAIIGIAETLFVFVITAVFGPEFVMLFGIAFAIVSITLIFIAIKVVRQGETER